VRVRKREILLIDVLGRRGFKERCRLRQTSCVVSDVFRTVVVSRIKTKLEKGIQIMGFMFHAS